MILLKAMCRQSTGQFLVSDTITISDVKVRNMCQRGRRGCELGSLTSFLVGKMSGIYRVIGTTSNKNMIASYLCQIHLTHFSYFFLFYLFCKVTKQLQPSIDSFQYFPYCISPILFFFYHINHIVLYNRLQNRENKKFFLTFIQHLIFYVSQVAPRNSLDLLM